jgi:hypothetical protein
MVFLGYFCLERNHRQNREKIGEKRFVFFILYGSVSVYILKKSVIFSCSLKLQRIAKLSKPP